MAPERNECLVRKFSAMRAGCRMLCRRERVVPDPFSVIPYISAALVLIGSVGLLRWRLGQRRIDYAPPSKDGLQNTSEWHPTGKIDFKTENPPRHPEEPAPFILKV